MANSCDALGKTAKVGNLRSHAMNKTKRRQFVNLQKKSIEHNGQKYVLTLSTKAIRILDKLGTHTFLTRYELIR